MLPWLLGEVQRTSLAMIQGYTRSGSSKADSRSALIERRKKEQHAHVFTHDNTTRNTKQLSETNNNFWVPRRINGVRIEVVQYRQSPRTVIIFNISISPERLVSGARALAPQGRARRSGARALAPQRRARPPRDLTHTSDQCNQSLTIPSSQTRRK